MRSRVLALGLWTLAVACGGNVEGGGSEDRDPEGGEPTTPNASMPDPDDTGLGSDNPDADTDLGSCKLGPVETYSSATPCAWVANMRCYESREMACNCACPRSRNSQCASGFESGPDGHVWVACN
jgi:hypothetical protein